MSFPKHALVKLCLLGLLLFLVMALFACNPHSRGFVLPPGDVTTGEVTFVQLGCNDCHSVGQTLPKREDGHPDIHFKLGGSVTRVKRYGDLVTSIINPSHKISGYVNDPVSVDDAGQSTMRNYNDVMTVQQLVDLTTYLQSTYELVQAQYVPYVMGP